MIAAAYLVLTICGVECGSWLYSRQGMAAVNIPQPSMDQCIRQANAFNTHRKDTRAMCVPGAMK